MSKVDEWQKKPIPILDFGTVFMVVQDGSLHVIGDDIILKQDVLKLADWIIENYGD